jgi:PadR family transcriptional regulator, regulatory protein PadR
MCGLLGRIRGRDYVTGSGISGEEFAGALDIKAGSLFPALYRLEAQGWITGEWGESRSGRRAKLYTLTKAGRRKLVEQKKSWMKSARAIQQILEM